MSVITPPLPDLADLPAEVVVPAPAPGPGNWSGAASAYAHEGNVYLAYRVRRPLSEGRGVATAIARSEDGIHFTTIAEVGREQFGAESFERPVLVPLPDGGWRLYVSCATPGSKHWWVEALDAPSLEALPEGRRTVVFAGDDEVAVKDPVIVRGTDGRWHAWLCEHPLDEPGEEDRMTTAYATSSDGLRWERHGTVLAPTGEGWDARGTRVSAVLSLDPLVVLYDGRRTAADNWHETTGVARGIEPSEGPASVLSPDAEIPVLRSTDSDGAFRYATSVPTPGGGRRFYIERARPDGAHDLVTVHLDAGA